MSREIKFRFWDTQENGWMVDGREETNIYDFAFKKGMNWTFLTKEEALEGIVVCQFTGLSDKNGKEIYEGDVWSEGRSTGEIIYTEDGFKIQWIVDKNFYNDILRNHNKFGEVIGNIYKNPDLIGESHE